MWVFSIKLLQKSQPEQVKLKQTLKQHQFLRDANQAVSNCGRFSYFLPFTHYITTHNTTHST